MNFCYNCCKFCSKNFQNRSKFVSNFSLFLFAFNVEWPTCSIRDVTLREAGALPITLDAIFLLEEFSFRFVSSLTISLTTFPDSLLLILSFSSFICFFQHSNCRFIESHSLFGILSGERLLIIN